MTMATRVKASNGGKNCNGDRNRAKDMATCTTTRSSVVINTLDSVTWGQRGCDEDQKQYCDERVGFCCLGAEVSRHGHCCCYLLVFLLLAQQQE
jgi:hypothetical protein